MVRLPCAGACRLFGVPPSPLLLLLLLRRLLLFLRGRMIVFLGIDHVGRRGSISPECILPHECGWEEAEEDDLSAFAPDRFFFCPVAKRMVFMMMRMRGVSMRFPCTPLFVLLTVPSSPLPPPLWAPAHPLWRKTPKARRATHKKKK